MEHSACYFEHHKIKLGVKRRLYQFRMQVAEPTANRTKKRPLKDKPDIVSCVCH